MSVSQKDIKNKPTIRDVARQAEVSVATVSRVLNGLGGYSEETGAKVRKVIKELNFAANAIARSLSVKSSKIIGVLLPDTGTDVFVDVLHGIEKKAREYGYSIIICYTGVDGVSTLEYVKVLIANQVAGIIYGSTMLFDECFNLIVDSKIPLVLALTLSEKYDIPYYKVDDTEAVYDGISYLIKKGHRQIALIVGHPDDPIPGIPRLEGYIKALRDNGIEINPRIIKSGNFDYDSGISCMEELLDSKEAFTAVFATSDDMAVGAIRAAYQRGIKVPEDISVMGYDNTKISKMSQPNLTTISQPLYIIGETSAEKLLEIIINNAISKSQFLKHEIVERDSVKKIN